MEDYDQYLEDQKNRGKFHLKLFENLKPWHILVFAGLVLVASLIIKSNPGAQWVYFVLGGLGVLFVLSLLKKPSQMNQIPRYLAVSIALKDLQSETNPYRAFAHGTKFIHTGYFRDQNWDSGDGKGPLLFKYHIGFQVKEPGKGPKEMDYQMQPFNGMCKGVIDVPLGFVGEEFKDIKMIFPEKVTIEDKSMIPHQ